MSPLKNDFLLHMDYSNEPRHDILCVDIKSFFASVEAVERGQHPLTARIAVVSKPDSQGGLVLAASPKVKELYQIKTGSRVYEIPRQAKIQIVEPRMELYLEKNLAIIDIFKRYVPVKDLHVYSIDESFLDVSHSTKLFGSRQEISSKIQKEIWQELKLIATVGMGDNPLLAKLALDHEAKHQSLNNYQAYWSYESVPLTIWQIERLSDFWGIGSKTEKKLNRLGIYNLYDLAQSDFYFLKKYFGVMGQQLFFHAHGIDRTLLSDRFQPKENSFSKNQILPHDYYQPKDVEIVIREMTEENASRLRKHKLVTGVVKLTIGYSKEVLTPGFNRQMKIEASDSSSQLIKAVLKIFHRYYENYPVRTINVSFKALSLKQERQLSLFEPLESLIIDEELDEVVDLVRQKYGYTSLLHASSLTKNSMAIRRSKLLGGHQANTK